MKDLSALSEKLLSGSASRSWRGPFNFPQGSVPITWSFDAGLPDPSTFPLDDFSRIADAVLRESPNEVLQYGGLTMGDPGLRAILAERARTQEGIDIDASSVMLTSGGVQALSLACNAFLDPGDVFAVEAPTWGAVLMNGQRAGAEAIAIPMDSEGLQVDALEAELTRLRSEGRQLKMLYTITTFNTPTGWSLSLPRRRRLLELAEEYEFIVLEDNVYGELRYDGETLPTLMSLDTTGLVVKVDSISKTLAPALRVGWISGQPHWIGAMAGVRGDLGISPWLSRISARFFEEGLYDPHLARVNELYRRKRDLAASLLNEYCGQWVSFEIPEGGYFLWIHLSDEIDGAQLATKSLEAGVACRPGERFFGESDATLHQQWLRMAFSMVAESELERGIAAFGKAMADSAR